MNNYNNNKILIFFVLIILVGVLSLKFLPQEKNIPPSDTGLRIGAGDDVTGILVEEILKSYGDNKTNKPIISTEDNKLLDNYTFKDC